MKKCTFLREFGFYFTIVEQHKAELLQLNRTQFPSLGIFVSKKVGNQKKLRPLLLYKF